MASRDIDILTVLTLFLQPGLKEFVKWSLTYLNTLFIAEVREGEGQEVLVQLKQTHTV